MSKLRFAPVTAVAIALGTFSTPLFAAAQTQSDSTPAQTPPASGTPADSSTAPSATTPQTTTTTTTAPLTADASAQDIVTVASSNPDLSTFVKAIQAAGLTDTLKGTGPFTVFAPTNEAFAKLPQKKLDELMTNKEALTKLLNYHVLPGKYASAQFTGLTKATDFKTVGGGQLKISVNPTRVDGAAITRTDVTASNGVIHIIDHVLTPKDEKTKAADDAAAAPPAAPAAGSTDTSEGTTGTAAPAAPAAPTTPGDPK